MKGRTQPVNPRPGAVVGLCTARGRILLHDPDALRRQRESRQAQERRTTGRAPRDRKERAR